MPTPRAVKRRKSAVCRRAWLTAIMAAGKIGLRPANYRYIGFAASTGSLLPNSAVIPCLFEIYMPEPRQYVEHRSALETLVGWIPGFHGYLEKEYRRDSDSLQRTWLADHLQRSKRAIDALSLRLADAGKLPLLPQCDRLRAKIDELIARIRGAWEGYTGVFDLVKVDQALLDRVYDHDVGLMHAVEDFVASIERLAGIPPSADAIAKQQAAAAPTVGAARSADR